MSKEMAVLRLNQYRKGRCIGENFDFTGNTSNLYEIEANRQAKAALCTAILFRGYEIYMLHCEDDGWYYGDMFLGLNAGAAFIEFFKKW